MQSNILNKVSRIGLAAGLGGAVLFAPGAHAAIAPNGSFSGSLDSGTVTTT